MKMLIIFKTSVKIKYIIRVVTLDLENNVTSSVILIDRLYSIKLRQTFLCLVLLLKFNILPSWLGQLGLGRLFLSLYFKFAIYYIFVLQLFKHESRLKSFSQITIVIYLQERNNIFFVGNIFYWKYYLYFRSYTIFKRFRCTAWFFYYAQKILFQKMI